MSAENTPNDPKFICPICLPKLKSSGFHWKKASLGVLSPWQTLFISMKWGILHKDFKYRLANAKVQPAFYKNSQPFFFWSSFFPSFLGYIISSNLSKSSTQISQRDKQHKFATTSLVSVCQNFPSQQFT